MRPCLRVAMVGKRLSCFRPLPFTPFIPQELDEIMEEVMGKEKKRRKMERKTTEEIRGWKDGRLVKYYQPFWFSKAGK